MYIHRILMRRLWNFWLFDLVVWKLFFYSIVYYFCYCAKKFQCCLFHWMSIEINYVFLPWNLHHYFFLQGIFKNNNDLEYLFFVVFFANNDFNFNRNCILMLLISFASIFGQSSNDVLIQLALKIVQHPVLIKLLKFEILSFVKLFRKL